MDKAEEFGYFIEDSIQYLDAFDVWRKDAGITTATARVDHLGYQCGDSAEFEKLRAAAEPESVFVFQSMIAGRRIALARLAPGHGLQTSLGAIELIEICDQKPDGPKKRGFDHIEIYPLTLSGRDVAEMRALQIVEMESLRRKLNGEFRDSRLPRLPEFVPSGRKHHPTFDAVLFRRESGADFKVRIEPEPLLAKIARDEFR